MKPVLDFFREVPPPLFLFGGFLVLGILVFFFFQVGWRVLSRGLWKTLAVLLAILVVVVGAYRIGVFVDHLLTRHIAGYKAGTIFDHCCPVNL